MEHGWRTAGSDTAAGLVNNDVNRLPRRGESGFTLVEVLVAVVVLSITGLAAAQFAIGRDSHLICAAAAVHCHRIGR